MSETQREVKVFPYFHSWSSLRELRLAVMTPVSIFCNSSPKMVASNCQISIQPGFANGACRSYQIIIRNWQPILELNGAEPQGKKKKVGEGGVEEGGRI